MHKIGIIGFGRLGSILYEILNPFYTVLVYDQQPIKTAIIAHDLPAVCACDTLFIAVPIRHFEHAIQEITPLIKSNCTVIDTCSVKLHPVKVMNKYLPKTTNLIATHPLFGPDSFSDKNNHRIVMHCERDHNDSYLYWKSFFEKQQYQIIELTANEHDKLAASTQGITHLIGRTLNQFHAQHSAIDTAGYKALLRVMQQTCHDSWELFYDLQKFNPYSQQALEDFYQAFNEIRRQLS